MNGHGSIALVAPVRAPKSLSGRGSSSGGRTRTYDTRIMIPIKYMSVTVQSRPNSYTPLGLRTSRVSVIVRRILGCRPCWLHFGYTGRSDANAG